jgi:hypothetical protein
MWKRFVMRKDDAGADGGSGGGAAADGTAAGGAAAGATGAAAGGGAATGAAAGAAAGGAAAAGGQGAGAAGAGAGVAAGAETKATWPENWRETVSKDDAKVLARLGRYASPEAALQALIAAQNRIAAGELKPALNKNATPEELKEWRTAHGIPDAPDKYELKDAKVEEADKPLFSRLFKAAHDSNQTPEQVAAITRAFYDIKKEAMDIQATRDGELKTQAEDSLRAEWGTDFRRNMNLISGLLDASGPQDLKDSLLGGRLADGTPIGSSPAALRMLVSLALLQNPSGVVVPGGEANREGAIKDELTKLQKMAPGKKSAADDKRQRDLIDMAVTGGMMDAQGNWVK